MASRLISHCFLWATCFGLMAVACDCSAQPVSRTLLALSKTDHTLAIVDPVKLEVLARVPVGPDPHEVVASSDGSMAYVSNMGGGRLHELNIIDLKARKPLPIYDTGPLTGLHGLDFRGGKLWFTAEGAKSIGRYDPKTGAVDWIMGTGQNRTHMIYVVPDEKEIYTTNVESGTITILDDVTVTTMGPPGSQPHREWTETVIPVGRGSEGFDVSPEGRELWTAASDNGTIWVVDPHAKKVTATIDAKVIGANRLKFTPDGDHVLVSSLRNGDIVVYDAHSRKEVKRIPVGHGAAGILMDPNGGRAFVACTPDNYVAIIDLRKLEVTGRLDVGGGPDGLAWAVEK